MNCKGKKRSKVRFHRLPIGGFSLTCGPSQNPQFPFILLDRALVYYREIVNHAHGRREKNAQTKGDRGEAEGWDGELRNQTAKLLGSVNKLNSGSASEEAVAALASILTKHMDQVHEDRDRDPSWIS